MVTEETITVTLNNGQLFEQQSSANEDKKIQFLADIISELNKRRCGILTLYHPLGIYRLDDVSSIHFQETEPISEIPPMGFRIDRAIDEQKDQ